MVGVYVTCGVGLSVMVPSSFCVFGVLNLSATINLYIRKDRKGKKKLTLFILLPHRLDVQLGREPAADGIERAAPRDRIGDLIVLVQVVLGEARLDALVRVARVLQALQAARADARGDLLGDGAPLALDAQDLRVLVDADLGARQVHHDAQRRHVLGLRVRDGAGVVGDEGAELQVLADEGLEADGGGISKCCRGSSLAARSDNLRVVLGAWHVPTMANVPPTPRLSLSECSVLT